MLENNITKYWEHWVSPAVHVAQRRLLNSGQKQTVQLLLGLHDSAGLIFGEVVMTFLKK